MMSVSRAGSFSLCSSPEEAFLQSKPAFALEEGMSQPGGVYPPPDADMQARTGWSTPMDGTTAANSPLTSGGYLSTVSEIPEMTKPLPETTAPLLHFAIASGQIDTLRFLLARSNVALNARDNAGYTPLQRAIANGRTDMAAVLLEHGAAVDEDFKTGSGSPRL
jgi:ankyrin repeat protein